MTDTANKTPVISMNAPVFMNKEYVDLTIDHLRKMIMARHAGIYEFTPTDMFAHAVLRTNGVLPEDLLPAVKS